MIGRLVKIAAKGLLFATAGVFSFGGTYKLKEWPADVGQGLLAAKKTTVGAIEGGKLRYTGVAIGEAIVFLLDDDSLANKLLKGELKLLTAESLETGVQTAIKVTGGQYDSSTGLLVLTVDENSRNLAIGIAKPSTGQFVITANAEENGLSIAPGFVTAQDVKNIDFAGLQSPTLPSFKVSQSEGRDQRAVFDKSGSLMGLCFSEHNSICVDSSVLNDAVSLVTQGHKLARQQLGGKIKTNADRKGVDVYWTAEGSVLSRAGVTIGDLITHVNGYKISNSADFFRYLGYASPANLYLTIERNRIVKDYSLAN